MRASRRILPLLASVTLLAAGGCRELIGPSDDVSPEPALEDQTADLAEDPQSQIRAPMTPLEGKKKNLGRTELRF